MQKDHSLKGDKQYFQSIPLRQRSDYIQKMIKTPQISGIPKVLKIDYPNSGKFPYKNYNLNYYYLATSQKPKAVLFQFHGLNSHGDSLGYMGVTIAKTLGINSYALDFKNFGKSEGDERGYIDSFDNMVAQADAFIQWISNQLGCKPKIFISGLSLGGAVCLKLGINKPERYAGIVLLTPAIREVKESQYVLKKFGKALGFLFPKAKFISQNYQSGTRYKVDDLILGDPNNYTGKVVPGSIRIVLNAMQQLEELYGKFKSPYILFQAGIDKMVDPFAAIDLQDQSPSKDKTTIYYKQMWHAIHYEDEYEEIVSISIGWIRDRL